MKKNIFYKSLFASFLILSFVTTACSNIFSEKSKAANGKAKISLSINTIGAGKLSRSVLPLVDEEELSNIVLRGSLDGGTEEPLQSWDSYSDMKEAQLTIQPGSWNFTLSAQMNGCTFFGTASKSFNSGDDETLSFELSPASTVTYGGIDVTLKYSGNAASVEANLYQLDGSLVQGPLVLTPEASGSDMSVRFFKDITDASQQVEAGTYRLKIVFYGDSAKTIILTRYSALINVAAGFVSSLEQRISINQLYSITLELNEGELPAGTVVPENYSVFSEAIILPEPSKEHYVFDGWYTTSDFTGAPITVITGANKGNISLFAKWEAETQEVDISVDLDGDLSNITVDISGSTGSLTLTAKDALSGNVLGSEYSFVWSVDGTAQSSTTNPLTINASTWSVGIYDISLIASKNEGGETKNYSWTGQHVLASYAVAAGRGCSNITELLSAVEAASGDFSVVFYTTSVPLTDIESLASAVKAKSSSVKVSIDMSNLTDLTELPYSAFMDCNSLYSVKLPEGITEIASQTFRLCENLAELTIPSTVTSITGSAFYRCGSLNKVTLAAGNTAFILESDNALYSADKSKIVLYCNKTEQSVFTVPASVTEICDYAFNGADISGIEFESSTSLTKIGNTAFDCCDYLVSFEMPDSVTEIGMDVFCGCAILSSIHFSNNLTTIPTRACSHSESIVSVEIPEGVTTLGYGIFYGVSRLETIILPSTLTSIDEDVFQYTSLKNVYFRGTEEQKAILLSTTNENVKDETIKKDTVTWVCNYTGD